MQVYKNITLYGFTHALVDASCAALLFAMRHNSRLDAAMCVFLVVLYDVLAFALQPILGFMSDRLKSPSKVAAA
ncbi:hypothetical protein KQ723_16000, partial [Listeria monocytogenes]|nr:hypothetical protein [Listeria monocytogenes]